MVALATYQAGVPEGSSIRISAAARGHARRIRTYIPPRRVLQRTIWDTVRQNVAFKLRFRTLVHRGHDFPFVRCEWLVGASDCYRLAHLDQIKRVTGSFRSSCTRTRRADVNIEREYYVRYGLPSLAVYWRIEIRFINRSTRVI